MTTLSLSAIARYPRMRPTPVQAPATAILNSHTNPSTQTARIAMTPGPTRTAVDQPPQVQKPSGPRPRIPSVNDMRLLREYNKKYLGYADYDPSTASLGESFYARYLSLSVIGNDTRANDVPPQRPPAPRTLLRSCRRDGMRLAWTWVPRR